MRCVCGVQVRGDHEASGARAGVRVVNPFSGWTTTELREAVERARDKDEKILALEALVEAQAQERARLIESHRAALHDDPTDILKWQA